MTLRTRRPSVTARFGTARFGTVRFGTVRFGTGALVAALTIGALSGCAATTPTCTDASVFLVDNTTATTIAAGTTREWDDANGVVFSAQPVPAQIGDSSWALFAPVPEARSYATFLTTPGSERDPSQWRLWDDPIALGTGALLPAIWPGHFLHGTPAPVKASGGTYSMGLAYLDRPALSSAHVVKVYITTISLTAGSGAWTFSDAPACAAH